MSEKLNISPSVAIVTAGIIIAGAVLYTKYNPPQEAANDRQSATANVRAPRADDHLYGSPSAAVTLIEYSDFECPYCARVHPTLKTLVDKSGGSVAWIYRPLPLQSIHAEARGAALAGECIAEQLGNDGFFEFSERVFADQSVMSTAKYKEYAHALGADIAQYDTCTASEKYASRVDADTQEAYANGASGTPFTVVYGYGEQVPVSGAMPQAQFELVISSLKARH